MKIIDLTQLITTDMPVYPGTEQPKLTVANTVEKDGFRETLITFYSHTGTHMDAPFHIFGDKVYLSNNAKKEYVVAISDSFLDEMSLGNFCQIISADFFCFFYRECIDIYFNNSVRCL